MRPILNIPELNSREELMAMYARFNTLEIADRLGCSYETVRKRLHEFDIPVRNGTRSSVQTRIEKAVMVIQETLCEFDRSTRARIIGPLVEEVKEFLQKDPPCPICNQVSGHMFWCSMAERGNGRRIEG